LGFPPPTKRQARVLWFSLTMFSVAVVMVLLGLLVWGVSIVLHRLSAVMVPMAVALILAYILNPVVEFLQHRRNMPRMWAVTFVFGLAALLILSVLASALPGLNRESRKLVHEAPVYMEKIGAKLGDFADGSLGQQLPETWREALRPAKRIPPSTNSAEILPASAVTNSVNEVSVGTNAPSPLNNEEPMFNSGMIGGDEMIPALSHAMVIAARWFTAQLGKVSTWMEFLIGLMLVPVYLFYFLLEKEEITRHWTDYLPIKEGRAKDEVIFVLKAINECLIVFFRGQVLVALCVGVLLAAGYLLLGLNYAVLLGVVAGVLGIVPYLGTITSLVFALIVAGMQFGDWAHPLMVLGIAAVVKLLEDFIISPRIIGERSGLHPLTIIIAVMVGTTLFGGFLGAMLAIPLTAVLRTLMFRYIWTREPYGHQEADEVVEI
jgi:predicted PurR-regulated permease PerM